MSSKLSREPSGIGQRLKEERKRLGMSQIEFGKAGGVCRVTQIQYECEETYANVDYLNGVARIGTDIIYVVIGTRLNTLMLTAPEDERIEKAAFEIVENLARTLPGGELSAESRCSLYRCLRSSLIHFESEKRLEMDTAARRDLHRTY